MLTTEFSLEFDILYNSISSNAAPGIDEYEKSVFLTQAQEDYVRDLAERFDSSEKARRELANLVNSGVSSTPLNYPSESINQRSRFFNVNDDVMYIVSEKVKLSSTDACLKNKETRVIPIRHDEYSVNIRNPFKKPNGEISWRVDYKDLNSGKVVEIITVENSNPSEYFYRYIKYPKPIILEALPTETIRGLNVVTECELSESLHKTILDKAVNMALATTGNPILQARTILERNV